MPINLYWEEKGALLEIVGKLSLGDYRQVLKLALLDSRFDDSYYLIVDCTQQMLGKALSKWELEVLAYFTAGWYKERYFVSAAVVNPDNQANVDAAHCYAKLAANPHAIFTSLDDARRWVHEAMSDKFRSA
jgi:hypothetical protein